jgi:hypothetical protein
MVKSNMRFKRQKFSTVLKQLHFLQKKPHPVQEELESPKIIPPEPFNKLSALTREMKTLKSAVIARRKKETQQRIIENKSFLQFSTFELMEYNFDENTHSNVLEYLFDYGKNYDVGSNILSRFLESVGGELAMEISHLVQSNSYTIEREKSVGNGRMDVFICDPTHRFVIVIENKLLASVGERIEDNETAMPITQLDVYRKFVERDYKSYKKLFLLLSHTPIEEDHSPFIFADYGNLYKVLKAIKTDDPIVDQYKLLLHSLVHSITDKRELIEKIKSLSKNNNVDLNSLELINGAFYERN